MEWIWKTAIAVITLAILAGLVVLIVSPRNETEILVTPGTGSHNYQFGVFGAVKAPGYYSSEKAIRIKDAVELAGGLTAEADPVNSHLAKWIDDGETVIIPTVSPEEPTLTPIPSGMEKVDLNSADETELMKLPGIGKKRADDIITLRNRKGHFNSPEEILEIQGISEKLLENIYDLLIVN